jgi:hypothetical protein
MLKKISILALAALLSLSYAIDLGTIKREKIARKNVNDFQQTGEKMPYSALDGGTFDQSMNGYGWTKQTDRKVQVNTDPATGVMVGAIYRRLDNVSGSGTIGGMTGDWNAGFQGFAQTIYGSSIYSTEPNSKPGGRYPYSNEFINGYFFGTFNDMNLGPDGAGIAEESHPMFTVADVTFGWDLVLWSEPKRVEATEGGAVIPSAWTGTGDVVYNEVDGYYYWTQTWGEGLANLDASILDIVVGRSMTPTDPESWVWTDYNDLRFDCTDTAYGVTNMSDTYVAYCKDENGYGTGKGVILSVTNDIDDYALDSNGTEVQQNGKLSYMYTNNWGGDDGTGDWAPNWVHDEGGKFFQLEAKDIFDWYGEMIYLDRDSIGIDSLTNEIIWDTLDVAYADDPSLQFGVSAVATENNTVHVLIRVWPGTLDAPGSSYSAMYDGFKGGLYNIKGQFTEGGTIEWGMANFIANYVDNDLGWDEMEYKYYNGPSMSIGYAGMNNGSEVIFASWLDKPTSRALRVPDRFTGTPGSSSEFFDDAYFSVSGDGGNSWEIPTVVEVETGDPEDPIWLLKYGTNLTKTANLHEEAWTVSNRGILESGNLTVYAGHQYWDPNTLTVPDDDDFGCYAQYLRVWKITGPIEVGIEAEEVSMVKDFDLYQNYPNPFNPATEIKFALQTDSDVKLSIFNTKGEMVANLKDERMVKGVHAVNFDASSLNSGVYFYKLEVGGRAETKKMVLTK